MKGEGWHYLYLSYIDSPRNRRTLKCHPPLDVNSAVLNSCHKSACRILCAVDCHLHTDIDHFRAYWQCCSWSCVHREFGRRTDPWGTPHSRLHKIDSDWSVTTCLLILIRWWIHDNETKQTYLKYNTIPTLLWKVFQKSSCWCRDFMS